MRGEGTVRMGWDLYEMGYNEMGLGSVCRGKEVEMSFAFLLHFPSFVSVFGCLFVFQEREKGIERNTAKERRKEIKKEKEKRGVSARNLFTCT